MNTIGGMSGIALVGSILFCAGASFADLQRVEAVGIFGIKEGARSRVIPRDEAISRAQREGVSRVALELIGESAPEPGGLGEADSNGEFTDRSDNDTDGRSADGVVPPLDTRGGGRAGRQSPDGGSRIDPEAPTSDEVEILRSALGKDMLPYTRSYKILEDQGERPVLFDDSPGIKTEYVVVIEVIVDVERVNAALERAGLVSSSTQANAAEAVTLELVGLVRYEALEAVMAALKDKMGATRVQTLVFERERQVLSVEGPFGAEALSNRIVRYRNPNLILEPFGVDPEAGEVRVMGRWIPEPEGGDS
jgi:hypothetical protein